MKRIGMEMVNYNTTHYLQCETMEEYNKMLDYANQFNHTRNSVGIYVSSYETASSSEIAGKIINSDLMIEYLSNASKEQRFYAKPSTKQEVDREVKESEVYGGFAIVTYKEKGVTKRYYGVGHKTFNTKKEAKKYIDE